MNILSRSIFYTLFVSLLVSFKPIENGTLTVSVTNIKNSNGEIDFNLFNSSTGFPGEPSKTLSHKRAKISNGNCSVTFENIPFGTYAISIYHDENNDKQMNKSWYGKPMEGVSTSNNAKGGISGPPSFEEAAFKFTAQQEKISIKMNYF